MVEEDIGQRIMDKLDWLNESLEKKESFLKKNSHLHVMIETDVLGEMKKKAAKDGITLSEWCRKKLKDDSQLDRIERKMDKIIKL